MAYASPELHRRTGDKHHDHCSLPGRHGDLIIEPHHRIRLKRTGGLLDFVSGLDSCFLQRTLQCPGVTTEEVARSGEDPVERPSVIGAFGGYYGVGHRNDPRLATRQTAIE